MTSIVLEDWKPQSDQKYNWELELKTVKYKQPGYFDPHNPKNFGGIWSAAHLLAKDKPGINPQMRADVRRIHGIAIKDLFLSLSCDKCVNHIRQFMVKDPIEAAIVSPEDHALFDWTVRAHNFASSNAGHPTMSIQDARELWYTKCKKSTCQVESETESVIRLNLTRTRI